MNPAFTLIESNLGLEFELIVLLIVVVANILFYVKDFKIGAIMNFFTMGLLFMWFYYNDWNFTYALILMFVNLIIMTLGLYAVSKTQQSGAFI